MILHQHQIRTASASNVTNMTFTGRAVPWNTPTTIILDGQEWIERFDRGALVPYRPDMPVYIEHERTGLGVALVTRAEDQSGGYDFTATFHDTTAGRDAYAVARAADLGLSIGFVPDEYAIDEDAHTITHTRAVLHEISLTFSPAYPTAGITAVRHERTPMPTDDTTEAAALTARAEDAERRLALLERRSAAPSAPQLRFGSIAEVVQGLAARSTTMDDLQTLRAAALAARAEIEGRAAQTSEDSVIAPAWLIRELKIIDRGRPLWGIFNRETLPDEGMQVAYPAIASQTDATGQQTAEGDPLGMVTLKITPETADVGTWGNAAQLTRQAIERASASYLAGVLRAQRAGYAKSTNSALRAALTGATGVNTAAVADPTDITDWITAGIDGAVAIDDNSAGLTADTWIIGRTAAKILATITDTTGRPILDLDGSGANTFGTLRVGDGGGRLGGPGGLPVHVDTRLTGDYAYIVSGDALTALESPGAPFALTDDNILHLTRDFALYGYAAFTLNDAKGIVKVQVG